METKTEDTYNYPDTKSKDREEKMKVRDTQKDILKKIDTMDGTMIKLVKTKYIVYEKIRDMKKQLQDITNEIEQHDKYILKIRKNIARIADDVKVQLNESRFLRKKMEEHDIKLNASGTISRKPWALQSDTVKYPILQAYKSTSRYARLAPMLEKITLKGDNVMEIR